MTIQQAIEKAIEGGYEEPMYELVSYEGEVVENEIRNITIYQIILDPQFWQCLGKAMGWNGSRWWSGSGQIPEWQYQWHSMIDHLSEGKSIEDYFKIL